MATPIKQSSVGKKIVDVSFDLGHGIKTLSIENVSPSPVCFKIQTYEPRLLEYLPNKGTIPTEKSMDVEVKELKKGTLATLGGGLNLHLVAMAWPSSSGNTFDQSMWKQLEAKNEPNQVISFGQVPKYAGIVDEPPKPKPSSKGLESGTRSSVVGSAMKKIIDVEPSRLSFKPPSSGMQTLKVALKNVSSSPVAVKIQTNKRLLYSVNPGKAVVAPGKQTEISIEAKVTQKDVDTDKERHVMCFIAVPWPSATKEIDAAEFKKIEEEKKKVQKLLMDVDFKGEATKDKGACTSIEKPSTSKYVDAKPLTVTFGPPYKGEVAKVTLKNREATSVAYKLQTNRQQLYSVHPNRGVIKCDGSEVVKIQIVNTVKEEELFDKTDTHQFLLLAAPWTRRLGDEFDPAEWTKLQASLKDKMQKETMNVELSKKKVGKNDGAKNKAGEETRVEEDEPKKKKVSKGIDKSKGKGKKENEEDEEDEGTGSEEGKGKKDKEKGDKDDGKGKKDKEKGDKDDGKEKKDKEKDDGKGKKEKGKGGKDDGKGKKEKEKDDGKAKKGKEKDAKDDGKGKKGKEKSDKEDGTGTPTGKGTKGSKEENKDDKKNKGSKKETGKKEEKGSKEDAKPKEIEKAKGPVLLVAAFPTSISYHIPPDAIDKNKTLTVINISKAAVAYKLQADDLLKKQFRPESQDSMQGVIQPGEGQGAQINLILRDNATVDKTVECKSSLKAVAWSAAAFDEKVWKEKEAKKDAGTHFQTVSINVKLVKAETKKPTKKPVVSEDSDSDTTDKTDKTTDKTDKSDKTEKSSEAESSKTEQASKQKEDKAPQPIECPADAFETTGPKLVRVTSGTAASSFNAASVNLLNSSEHPIAFKCSDSDRFTGTPSSGVLQADTTCKITIKINEHIPASEEKNKFKIMAVSWPEDVKNFEASVWDKQKEKQTIVFKAGFEKA